MRRVLVFLILGLVAWLAAPCSLPAAEVLLGRVVSLDREKGSLELEVDNSAAGKRIVRLQVDRRQLEYPAGRPVQPGDILRVWGSVGQDRRGEPVFRVQRFGAAGKRYGNRADPTGVRDRLGRAGRSGAGRRSRGAARGGHR